MQSSPYSKKKSKCNTGEMYSLKMTPADNLGASVGSI